MTRSDAADAASAADRSGASRAADLNGRDDIVKETASDRTGRDDVPTAPGASAHSSSSSRVTTTVRTADAADGEAGADAHSSVVHADAEPGTTTGDGSRDSREMRSTHRDRRHHGRLLVGFGLVLALVFAAVMTVLYFVTGPAPVAGLTSTQQAAVDAARQEAINLQTYRRSSFDQDFNNALAGMTPDFAKTLQAKKDALQQQLSQGNVDATATALASGLVSSTATKATVLVVTNSVQTSDDGTTTPFVFSRLQLTLDYTGGKWLVSDLTNIGLS